MSEFTSAAYDPAERQQLFELMRSVGRSHIDDAEFDWWFERNPASRRLISVARADGRVVGMAAMSFFRMLLNGGEQVVAVPVHVATEAEYRRRGVFSALELRNEKEAAAAGSPVTITFPNTASHRVFVGDLGWRDLPGRRLWARPLRPSSVVRYLAGRPSGGGGLRPFTPKPRRLNGVTVEPLERFGAETDAAWREAAGATGNQFVRDAVFLNWRYVDSPRDYRRFAAYRGSELAGFAVMGHTVKHGVSSGFLADLVTRPGREPERIALLRRCVGELASGTDALIALPPRGQGRSFLRAGFLPTHKRIRFIGKELNDATALDAEKAAWHFTLGDFDFF
jgi:GNAT superfamily N-acetyltransferase